MDRQFFHNDIRLFLERRVDWKRYHQLRRPGPVNLEEELDTYRSILGSTGQICEDIEAESRDHWHEEVRLEDGDVIVPAHIESGYQKLREAGLVCVMLDPKYGGFGLPTLLNVAYLEMLSRADTSLMTILGLQAGAANDIQKYGSDELKEQYLPRFTSGEVQGCMDLTEPGAGSDLGGISTRVTEEDGKFFIDGGKIFITNGGAEIHLVLARDSASYDESKGTTNGLNLMLCPRTLPDGSRNGVSVSRIESKMGLHGSPTCAVDFDHAEGYLLGERGNGFRAMLDLMNAARIGVSAQGIGIAEAAYREARTYAGERIQFGAPIIEQPLVKSMLTLMALEIQAARTLLYHTATLVDQTEALETYLASDRDEPEFDRIELQAELERNHQLVRFFTPLCKYYATEVANQVTRSAIQVHGGIGYMAESVVGHCHSDSIITTIYEGTSEIQASFALREMAKGALFTALDQLRVGLDTLAADFPEPAEQLRNAIDLLTDTLPSLMEDVNYALLNAKRVSDMVISVVVGGELLQQCKDEPTRIELASAYINRTTLELEMHAKRIKSGDASRLLRYDKILSV
ncbi:MAG: acyl-CoA dehydrogenase family protein [Candidatus Binatia bacterium]|nr:acyl-CoA dehydrogenase family protein [Candidatus Binatia bacterium]